MNKKTIPAVVLILACFLPVFSGPPADYLVDWQRGAVVSFGRAEQSIDTDGTPIDDASGRYQSLNNGRLDSYNKAREQAIANLVKALKTIRVDSDKTLKSFLKNETVTQARLYAIIQKKTKFREYPQKFNSTECRAELKIGDIMEAIPYKYPAEPFPELEENPIRTKYTSLIIDARGLKVEPMIFPSVFNETGLEIYSRHHVDVRAASYTGLVSFVSTEHQAFRHRKAGTHPYVTVAVRALNGCPVITARDMRRVFSHEETRENLKKCRVIFIIGENKKEDS